MVRAPILAALALAACTSSAPAIERPAPAQAVAPAAPPAKPGPPDWRPMPSIPVCDALYAVRPETIAPLEWKPCPGGQAGCRDLVDPKPPDPSFETGVDIYLRAGTTASGVYLVVHDEHVAPERARVSVGPLDGPPFLVIDFHDYKGPCRLGYSEFAADAAALVFYRAETDMDSETIYFTGPLRADPAWFEPAARVPPRIHGVDDAVDALLVVDINTGRFVRAPASTEHEYVVGASFVSVIRSSIVAGPLGAPPRVLHTAPGRWIGPVRTDGGALYWVQAIRGERPRDLSGGELWTATATDDPAELAARKVCDIDPGIDLKDLRGFGHGTIGGDKVAAIHVEDEQAQVDVIDVATGKRRRWRPEGDTRVDSVLFVSADELGLAVQTAGLHGYRRVRLDALAPL
jgi:hypothetical protein